MYLELVLNKRVYTHAAELRKTPVSMLETSDAKLREDLIQRLVDFKVMGPVGQMVLCNDPSTLPMKELPHGSVSNLFLMYLAYANILGERPASRATFYREAKKWRCCMRFHKVTVHSICTTCARLKMKIREASVPQLSNQSLLLPVCVCVVLASSHYICFGKGLCRPRQMV